MAALVFERLRQEVDLMERFSQSYRRKFAAVIRRLNGAGDAPADAPTDLQCMRLCVEAVDMMLASQSQVARSLRELADGGAVAGVGGRKVA